MIYTSRWHVHRLTAAALISGGLWLLIPTDMYDVPARDGVQAMLWPLAPALFAALLPTTLSTAAGAFERTVRNPIRLRLLITGIASALALCVILCGASVSAPIAIRNTTFLIGLAFLGTAVLPAGASWTPPVFTPMVMWLTGSKATGQAYSWAVLLLPADATYAWIASYTIAAAGLGAYILYGPRH